VENYFCVTPLFFCVGGIKFSLLNPLTIPKNFIMTSSSPQKQRNSVEPTLAPVIPLRSAPKENGRPGGKVSKIREDMNTPMFYDKPIFKTKKYDLL